MLDDSGTFIPAGSDAVTLIRFIGNDPVGNVGASRNVIKATWPEGIGVWLTPKMRTRRSPFTMFAWICFWAVVADVPTVTVSVDTPTGRSMSNCKLAMACVPDDSVMGSVTSDPAGAGAAWQDVARTANTRTNATCIFFI